MQRAQWKIVAWHYPCLTCNAGPGEPCRRPGGGESGEVHVCRSRLASANGWRDPDEVMNERPHDHDRRG